MKRNVKYEHRDNGNNNENNNDDDFASDNWKAFQVLHVKQNNCLLKMKINNDNYMYVDGIGV